MNIIKKLITLDKTKLETHIKDIINQSKETRQKVYNTKKSDIILKLLMNDAYVYSIYSNVLYYLALTNKNNKEMIDADIMMQKNNYEFNYDSKLYDKLIDIVGEISNTHHRNFVNRMMKSMKRHGINKNMDVLKTLEKIDICERDLICKLTKKIELSINGKKLDTQSESILSTLYTDGHDKILINNHTFYHLLKRIDDPIIRNSIETTYMTKTEEDIEEYAKLIMLRDSYAKGLGHNSYFQLITNNPDDESANIKKIIIDIMDRINNNVNMELDNISKMINVKNRKLRIHDIVYASGKIAPIMKFKFVDVLSVIMLLMKKYFNITFAKSNIFEKFLSFECKLNGEIRGYLHIDSTRTHNRGSIVPKCICFNERFKNDDTIVDPNICIVASYPMEDNIMSFRDVISIFRTFGNVLERLIYNTENALLNEDNEFAEFMPQLMEHLLYDRTTLKLLCRSERVVDTIIDHRNIDICFSLKMKCINAIFDHMLHIAPQTIMAQAKMEKKGIVIIELYKGLFREWFDISKNKFNINIDGIPPTFIIQNISGYQGMLYGNIISDILAYNVSSLILKGKGNEFINTMANPCVSFLKSINKFIDNIGVDPYQNYLEKLMNVTLEESEEEEGYYENDTEINVDNIVK